MNDNFTEQDAISSFLEDPKEELERQRLIYEANIVAQRAREIRYKKKMDEAYDKLQASNDDV